MQFIFDTQDSPTVHSKVGFGRADMVNVDLKKKNFNPPGCPAVGGPRNDAILPSKEPTN